MLATLEALGRDPGGPRAGLRLSTGASKVPMLCMERLGLADSAIFISPSTFSTASIVLPPRALLGLHKIPRFAVDPHRSKLVASAPRQNGDLCDIQSQYW
jgi:hypothetical protein